MDELTEFQLLAITSALDSGNTAFVYMEPSKTDKWDYIEKSGREMEQLIGLMNMDLIVDISDKFQDKVTYVRESAGTEFHVFKLTDIAVKMFQDCEDRLIN